MSRDEYAEYVRRFHARDYDGLLAFYGDDPVVEFAGYALTGREAIKTFYAFFHQFVRETIHVERYVADEATVALEAIVRLEGVADLTRERLAAEGFERLEAISAGQVVEIPQFIHYHLEGGRFARALCAVSAAPRIVS